MALIPGNLLSENNQSVETSVGGWGSFTSVSSGVVQSGTQFFEGTKSVQSTCNSTSAGALGGLVTTIDLPVAQAGVAYAYSYFVYSPKAAIYNANIDWYQSNNTTFISSSNSVGQTATVNTWTRISGGGIAPALSGVARMYLQVTSGLAVNDVIFFDVMFFGQPVAAELDQQFRPGWEPGLAPVSFRPWQGAPDSDHAVIVNAGAANITFRNPSPQYFALVGLTNETGASATAQALSNIADPAGQEFLFLPDDPLGGIPPWQGAPDTQVAAVSVTAGVAALSFTALQPTVDIGALPGAASVSFAGQTATAGLSALPGAASVSFAGQTATAGLSALPGAASVSFAGQTATVGLSALPGAAPLSFAGQTATAGLGALPGAASVSFAGQTATAGLGILSGAAPLSFAGQTAAGVPVDSPFASAPPLLTPDDPLGGMQPWTGAPQGQIAADATVNAGVASLSFTALQPTVDIGALPGAASVAFAGQTATAGLSALPGAASLSFAGQTATAGLGVSSGAASVVFAGQTATAGLGALSGAASVTTSVLQDTAALGALPGAAPLAFTGQQATVSTLEDQQSLPFPLFVPSDVTGGLLPWAGAPQGLVTGDMAVNAGVAALTLAAANASTGLVVGAGAAPLSLAAQSPSAAFSGTATPGTATITLTAPNASTGLVALPSAATSAFTSSTPAAGTGALSGAAVIGLTAYDPTVIVPQAASGRTISGREPGGSISGREYTALATGREGSARLSGREPVSSRSGEEPDNEISGRET